MTTSDFKDRWDASGPEFVAPGVHRIPLPLPNDGLRAVNVYCIEDDDGLVMVDGGWAIPESMRALEVGLGSLGRDPADIRRVLVSHVHSDHYTQAVTIRRQFGARIGLGAGERETLKRVIRQRIDRPLHAIARLHELGAPDLALRLERDVSWHSFDPAAWELPDEWLNGGTVELASRRLEVIPTPGHTQGHVVFVDDDNGLCFAGDHVLPYITPSIGLEEREGTLPLADYLASLKQMLEIADSRLLPAHGPADMTTHVRVHELIAHHEHRLRRCQAVVEAEPHVTASDVAEQLPWTRRNRPFDSLDDFNRLLAINETAAHLDVLVQRGDLVKVSDAEVGRYTTAMAA